MLRIFAYCRVSVTDQTTQNQSIEIKAAIFAVHVQAQPVSIKVVRERILLINVKCEEYKH